jgi:hypothetical protein
MSKIAEYARIFETGTSDEWVEKRKGAAQELMGWFRSQSPQEVVTTASALASSIAGTGSLPESIALQGEQVIQRHASSFVRSADQGELQITVLLAAAAIDVINETPTEAGWTAPDALAAALWSALSFQRPLGQPKIENLRKDLLNDSRERVRTVAETARKRQDIPEIGAVSIDQDSEAGTKVNTAFRRAVEPMVFAMRNNAALDREELDFMWWLLSERSEILDEPLSNLDNSVRAVIAGFDAAEKLRKLPADAHRNIVLRGVARDEPLSLSELLGKLGERRSVLKSALRIPPSAAPDVFPLIRAIVSDADSVEFSDEKRSPLDWGARALLEGAIIRLYDDEVGGL